MIATTPVRFEHHNEAFGIGESEPRLSWVVTSAPQNWATVAYELEQRNGSTVRVESEESNLVPWPFAPLTSREQQQIRVRLHGADGMVGEWSDFSTVEAGLLDATDWSASFIEIPDTEIAAPLVRGTFEVAAPEVTRARLYLSAHGLFRAELNGRRVGDDELAPGWTAYQSRLRYLTYDVTEQLNTGSNVLGVRLADGWWRGHLGWGGKKALYGDTLGLIAQLEIDHADGSRQVIGSGEDWTFSGGGVLESDLYNGEHFDARAEDPTWSTSDFDAADWSTVRRGGLDPSVTLVAPQGPPVRVVEQLAVREVSTTASGAKLLDFGQNLVGRLRITVRGESGTVLTLRHAEVLQDGELATEPLRDAKATDSYTLRGGDTETWSPTFTFHGFRYAEISGWPGTFSPVPWSPKYCIPIFVGPVISAPPPPRSISSIATSCGA